MRSKTKSQQFLIFISWYQIIGGTIGVIVTAISIIDLMQRTYVVPQLLTVSVCFFVVYMLIIISGVFLLKKRKGGVALTCITQIVQIPYFILGGIQYGLISGAKLVFLVQELSFQVSFHIGSKIIYSAYNDSWMIGINVIPILIMYLLFTIITQNNDEVNNHTTPAMK